MLLIKNSIRRALLEVKWHSRGYEEERMADEQSDMRSDS